MSADQSSAPMFDAQNPCKKAAEKHLLRLSGRTGQDLFAIDRDHLLRRVPHAVRHFVRMTENNIVRHDVLIFVEYADIPFFQQTNQFQRRNVAHAHRFARRLENKRPLFLLTLFNRFCKTQHVRRWIKRMDRVPESDQIVTVKIYFLLSERERYQIDLRALLLECGFILLCDFLCVPRSREVNDQNFHRILLRAL